MNRFEFMQALERALYDVSAEEKEAALQYYNDYLDDAGPENEQSILEEWESPSKLAESIRSGMNGRMDAGEFTENGFSSGEDMQCPAEKHMEFYENEKEAPLPEQSEKTHPNLWKWVAIALLCLLLAPICIPVIVTVVVIIIGIIITAIAITGVLAVAGVAILLVGLAVTVVGLINICASPAGAVVLLGAGLIVSALGWLVTLLFGWLLFIGMVKMFRLTVELCRKPFHKKRKEGQI